MDFDLAIERVLQSEGGFSINRSDPGNWTGRNIGLGELKGTKYGISAAQYPNEDIEHLTLERCKQLYMRDFWNPIVKTATSDLALQFQLLDAAVNHGIDNAIRMLQRAADVAVDGHWGPVSQAALDAMDPHDAHLLFMAARFEFWSALRSFDSFGRGWVRRGAMNLRYLAQDN